MSMAAGVRTWAKVVRAVCRRRESGRSAKAVHAKGLIRDEDGVTSVGMAVSLLLCLSLLFSGAQLYRVGSASSEIQEVADVAVLAAESEVAEFMVAVRACDAAVLSMTLLAGTVYGIGIVAACVPPAAPLSEQLISLGGKVVKARDQFAEKASWGLNRLQDLLPFLAAASAASVASACNGGAMEAQYYAIGVLVPEKGEAIDASPHDGLSELSEEVDARAPEIREQAAAAEEAARKASEAKRIAFEHDCGAAPGYCQYERAGRFPWMPEGLNPLYSSVDAWSFSAALERAKGYYRLRKGCEAEPSGGVAEKASYHLRMVFYAYALEELEREGFVREEEGSFQANFPQLFRNVNEFRQSRLYDEARFPVSGDGVMHAYEGCPAAGAASAWRGVSALESGACAECPTCGFSLESIGNVASASTNIANGFEHHYEKIRQAALAYQQAREEMDPLVEQTKEAARPLLDAIGSLMSKIGGQRISAEPPGASGAICVVVNLAKSAADAGFESAFVSGGTVLGIRAAVSAAALVEDVADDSSSVITSLLDGFGQDAGAVVGGARIVLDCWSGLLRAYENGQAALSDAVGKGLDAVSVGTLSGLGAWARDALSATVQDAGLEPANLNALKPALLNTGHVSESDEGAFAVRFRQVKAQALSGSSSGSLVSALAGGLPDAVVQVLSETTVTIAEIEFPVGGVTIPLEITLPQSAAEAAGGLVEQCIAAIDGAVASAMGVRQWR